MATISLQGSIRGCRVDSGWAARIQSDRFENPNLMTCPVWNGSDMYGRQVCPDSFYTKNAGCNSSADRISVENVLRPQYIEYITLDAQGINGNMFEEDSAQRNTDLRNLRKVTGSTGVGYGGVIATTCSNYRYDDAQAKSHRQLLNAPTISSIMRHVLEIQECKRTQVLDATLDSLFNK